jgi:hypothetical protein
MLVPIMFPFFSDVTRGPNCALDWFFVVVVCSFLMMKKHVLSQRKFGWKETLAT